MASCRHATRIPYSGTAAAAGLFLCGLAAALLIPRAQAQNAEADDIYYSRFLEFKIPFQAKDSRIREVILHASEDQGRTWKQVANAQPSDNGFRFSARHDGWYYFTVQTRDFETRLYPASVDQTTKPGLRVCVDTQPPVVRLDPITPREGGVGVKWEVRDDNLDLRTLVLEYRAGGAADWTRLDTQRIAAGQHVWNPASNAALEVRLLVRDLAGNEGKGSSTIAAGERPRYTGPTTEERRPTTPSGTVNVRYVRSKRISLNYDLQNIGKSGISVVELWMTLDGRSWQMESSQQNPKPPFEFDVAEERRYGFTLIAKSGVGLGDPPPRVGDPPQIWVEVDVTKPVVQLESVTAGRGADLGKLTILYRASDRNLADKPITISYAEKADGQWTPIVKGEENHGRYVWQMPPEVPYQMFIRVEAIDRAGNIGGQDTPQPVAVDLSQPKVRVIDVAPANK
jgi:hypothetical protein